MSKVKGRELNAWEQSRQIARQRDPAGVAQLAGRQAPSIESQENYKAPAQALR
jgi:hypothetical protein